LFTKTLYWYDVLNAKGIRKRIRYLRAVMRDGHKLDDKPRIEVSTIHASKGGERDNVMLLTDLSYGLTSHQKIHNKGVMMSSEFFMLELHVPKKN